MTTVTANIWFRDLFLQGPGSPVRVIIEWQFARNTVGRASLSSGRVAPGRDANGHDLDVSIRDGYPIDRAIDCECEWRHLYRALGSGKHRQWPRVLLTLDGLNPCGSLVKQDRRFRQN